jgi:hypothetical protein
VLDAERDILHFSVAGILNAAWTLKITSASSAFPAFAGYDGLRM